MSSGSTRTATTGARARDRPPAAPPSQRPPRMPAGAGSGRPTEPGRRQPAPDRAARAVPAPYRGAPGSEVRGEPGGAGVTPPVRGHHPDRRQPATLRRGEFGLSPTDGGRPSPEHARPPTLRRAATKATCPPAERGRTSAAAVLHRNRASSAARNRGGPMPGRRRAASAAG